MATLDGSILNVALPTISREFNCAVDVVAWVVLAYTLTTISLLLLFGVWSGKKGYYFSYMFGYALFLTGSIVCALSTGMYMLIFGRIVQATGSAMFAAVGPGMVTQIFPASQRGKGIGMMVMMVAAGFMIGPPLGGLLLDQWRWPAIFVINIPVGLIGLLMTYLYFRNIPPTDAGGRVKVKGAVAMSAALVLATFALSLFNDYHLSDVRVWGPGILSLAAMVAFFRFESRRETAMIGLDIFKNRQFTSSIGAMLFMFMAMSGVLILIPFYLERIKHFQPKQVGFFLIILPVLMFIIAPMSGRLSDRIGFRLLTSVGTAVLVGGLLLLGGLETDSTNLYIVLCLVVIGIGVGVFNTPNSSALMGSVGDEQRAVTSSILATTRNIGMSIGVALATVLFAFFETRNAYLGDDSRIFMASFDVVIYVAIGIAAVSFLFCLTRHDNLRR